VSPRRRIDWLGAVTCAALAVAPTRMASGSADDAAPSVAVIRPPLDDHVLREAGLRIRSELTAAGVASQFVDCPPRETMDPSICVRRAELEIGGRGHFDATICLSREDGVPVIDAITTLTDDSAVRRRLRVPSDEGGDDPAVLAVRSVEVLRDMRLDIRREARPHPDTAAFPDAPETRPEGPASSLPVRWRIMATAEALQGRLQLGPSIGPALGVSATLGPHTSFTARVAGPFFRSPTARTGEGASIRQEDGALGICYELGAGTVRSFGTVEGGLYHLSVRGMVTKSSPPVDVPVSSSLWAPLLAFGPGISVRVSKWMAAVGQGEVLLTHPAADVTVANIVVERAGSPSFVAQLGLWVGFP
jgi:hypothetical protein